MRTAFRMYFGLAFLFLFTGFSHPARAVAVIHVVRASDLKLQIPLGPYPVLIAQPVNIADKVTGANLAMRVYYPNGTGSYPVIIFSPGIGGSYKVFIKLAVFLSTHGFIVIVQNPPDSGIFQKLRTDRRLRRLVQHDGSKISQAFAAETYLLHGQNPLVARVLQIKEIIAALPQIQSLLPHFHGRFNLHEIGMAGHSFGAITTEVVAGALKPTRVKLKGVPCRQIAGAEVISGGGDYRGLAVARNRSTATQKPMLFITGSRDRVNGRGFHSREEAYRELPAGKKFLLFIRGATHMSYNGMASRRQLPGIQLSAAQIIAIGDMVDETSLKFWNFVLKHRSADAEFLYHNIPAKETAGRMTISHR